MDAVLSQLAASDLAAWMRTSRWGYAWVNALHVLGLAVLVGAVLPLDLRLIGAWRRVPLELLAAVLAPVAAAGLALATVSGGLLFLAGPESYAASGLFLAKMGLVAAGTLVAVAASARGGLASRSGPTRRLAGMISLACWLPALAMGRMLGYVLD